MKTAQRISLGAVLLLAACGDSSPTGSGVNPENSLRTFDFSAFEAEVDAFIADNAEVEGVGAIIVHRDEGVVLKRGFGNYHEDRISLIASSSKMITAGVLLRLQDQGILDMNEPIVEAVGEWGNDNPAITPAQLVSNSSGLVGLGPDPTYGPYLCQYLFTGTLQDCARQIFTTDQDDADVIPPDTEFRYGGAQWQVAGAVAEIVSGKSWAELIDETYTQPCGLTALGYNNHFVQVMAEDGDPFGYPPAFDGNPGVLLPSDNPNMEGGVYTSIADYGELLLMHLRGGMCGENRVLSEAAVAQLHEDRVARTYGNGPGYGMGWWVDRQNPSLITDPGAYGSTAWLDEDRGYGAFLVIEVTSDLGSTLTRRTIGHVNEAIDAAG
ncbi:MAG: serine hydrolase [Candidatus Binatia bacterium]|nr:serine hydrolase [Candidatus Binatia bacterium]